MEEQTCLIIEGAVEPSPCLEPLTDRYRRLSVVCRAKTSREDQEIIDMEMDTCHDAILASL